MKIGNEAIEQIKVIEWLKNCTKLPYIHIANERKTSIQNGSLLRRMGVRKGCSDIFIPRAYGEFHGLFIELKAGKNKATPSQLEFLAEMIAEGYGGFVATGAEECILIIKTFYNLK